MNEDNESVENLHSNQPWKVTVYKTDWWFSLEKCLRNSSNIDLNLAGGIVTIIGHQISHKDKVILFFNCSEGCVNESVISPCIYWIYTGTVLTSRNATGG